MDREQQIRLSLRTDGLDGARQAADSLNKLKLATDDVASNTYALATATQELTRAERQQVAETYELSTVVGRLGESHDRLNAELDESVRRATEATAAQRAMARALSDLDDGAGKTARSKRDLGRATLESGRALQDFSQGGVAGVLNNLEGLAASLGMSSGVAGALTAVGVAAYVAAPYIKQFFNEFSGQGSNKIPESADALVRLNDQLRANAKELDALRDKQSLTNVELAKFNDLTKQQEDLGRQRNEATKQRRQDEEIASLRPQAEKDRAEGFKLAVGEAGGGDRVGEMLRQALLNIAQQKGQDATLEGIANQADELIRGAASGDRNARDAIGRAMQFLPNGGRFAQLIQQNSPEGKAMAADGERHQKILDRMGEMQAKEDRAAFDAQNDAVYQDILNAAKQGADDERTARQAANRRKTMMDRTERGLGDQYLADATGRYAATQLLQGDQRKQAQEQLAEVIRRTANQTLLARGESVTDAAEMARLAPAVIEQELQRRAGLARGQGVPRGAEAAAVVTQAAGQLGLQNQAGLINAVGNLVASSQGLVAGQRAQEAMIRTLERQTERINQALMARNPGVLGRGNP